MASMKRPRLKAIEVLSDYRIKTHFIDDSIYTTDFKPPNRGNDSIITPNDLMPLTRHCLFYGMILLEVVYKE